MRYIKAWSESPNFKKKRPVEYLGVQKQLLKGPGNWHPKNIEYFMGPNTPIYGVEGMMTDPQCVYIEDKSCLAGVPMCKYKL